MKPSASSHFDALIRCFAISGHAHAHSPHPPTNPHTRTPHHPQPIRRGVDKRSLFVTHAALTTGMSALSHCTAVVTSTLLRHLPNQKANAPRLDSLELAKPMPLVVVSSRRLNTHTSFRNGERLPPPNPVNCLSEARRRVADSQITPKLTAVSVRLLSSNTSAVVSPW